MGELLEAGGWRATITGGELFIGSGRIRAA
jgi:hypothetical protein